MYYTRRAGPRDADEFQRQSHGLKAGRAVKEVKKFVVVGQELGYTRELEAIMKFSNDKYNHCFVSSQGWYELEDAICITMEYFELGDLQQYIDTPFQESEGKEITDQILEGLAFMHDNGFIHRDLKPANIMVVDKSPEWFVKIADFGISKRRHHDTSLLTMQRGTHGFAAPEVIGSTSDQSYTYSADMWSLGAMVYRILTSKMAFDSIGDLFKYVRDELEFLVGRRLGVIIMEKFSPMAGPATDFLITIAEPRSRPAFLHEYIMTPHSLYAAVSVGLSPEDIIGTLDRFLKTQLPPRIKQFVLSCTTSYGKVKLVLNSNRYFVESIDREILQMLLKDKVIKKFRLRGSGKINTAAAPMMGGIVIPGTKDAAGAQEANLPHKTAKQPIETNLSADVYPALNEDEAVKVVQKRCLDLSYPILEEYDSRFDRANSNLKIDLRPNTQIRPYQEKSLSKMLGNGRAKSGIIVLPCGAGKTLVGIAAACTIKKSVVVLCTSSVSAVQWRKEFLNRLNINPASITTFTAESKTIFKGRADIIVTTYSMVTTSRERSRESKEIMSFLAGREWGLMFLDEVHVVPANIFRQISHLNFLIGPKLYEANWMELSQQGHIAKVQCAEVWWPMPVEFYETYLKVPIRMKRILGAVNPFKFQACQHLINYHESRGGKIIVFSDDLYSLKLYAIKLGKAFIYGETSQEERMTILEDFQRNPFMNTLGRILRAKRRNDEGFNAFFYTLVSKDTQEMFYPLKRQAFLVGQGYAFKVIKQLAGIHNMPELAFAKASERQEPLKHTIIDNEKVISEEGETDYLFGNGKGKSGQKKTAKEKSKRNPFFRKLDRERERRRKKAAQ
ncbi:DNA helicase [Fusarium falciforme]|uniref:DNA helicase n=1 Tax=Fusarium falciforme TaxID=195108 RepID=UPI0022FFDAD9|nr:DNA helicase [Fusarium falciforme]WAO84476.1 DNA helicase [Fusarium falciforme]